MIRIGIVGHRFLTQPEADFTEVQCTEILKGLQAEQQSIVAYSAIAAGADSIFAGAALKLHIPLEIVLPFDAYGLDFEDEKAQETFLILKKAALKTTKLPYKARSVDAYAGAMQWILKKSDIVVAVWNGENSGGPGGTANAVNNIIRDGLDWIHLDIEHFSTNKYLKA